MCVECAFHTQLNEIKWNASELKWQRKRDPPGENGCVWVLENKRERGENMYTAPNGMSITVEYAPICLPIESWTFVYI